jgi:hypothetical protein
LAVIQQYALLIENECGERIERERERERLHSPIEIEVRTTPTHKAQNHLRTLRNLTVSTMEQATTPRSSPSRLTKLSVRDEPCKLVQSTHD